MNILLSLDNKVTNQTEILSSVYTAKGDTTYRNQYRFRVIRHSSGSLSTCAHTGPHNTHSIWVCFCFRNLMDFCGILPEKLYQHDRQRRCGRRARPYPVLRPLLCQYQCVSHSRLLWMFRNGTFLRPQSQYGSANKHLVATSKPDWPMLYQSSMLL